MEVTTTTDGDGNDDGNEDPDRDGLTNLEELRAGAVPHIPTHSAPSPVRPDLLVELDCMSGRCLEETQLLVAVDAFAAPTEGSVDIALPLILTPGLLHRQRAICE